VRYTDFTGRTLAYRMFLENCLDTLAFRKKHPGR
jgi:hypothetical protein